MSNRLDRCWDCNDPVDRSLTIWVGHKDDPVSICRTCLAERLEAEAERLEGR